MTCLRRFCECSPHACRQALRKSQACLIPLLMVALLSFGGCHNQEPDHAKASESAPVLVSLIRMQSESFATLVPVTGTLVSLATVDVKAETTGRVVRFDKMEGDAVRAGETIVWLDQERAELSIRQAETAVQVAEAALARGRVAESHHCQELQRARNLLSSGGITDRDLKSAEVAEQDGHAQVKLAQAQLEQAKAEAAVARKLLRDCQVRAPVSGTIHKKLVNPGAYVEAQTGLFSLVDNSRLELESLVASSMLGPLRPGQKARFVVASFSEGSFEGQVREINPALDSNSRSASVRIQVSNRSGRLRTGMFAQGEIFTGVNSAALVLPLSAVYRDDTSNQKAFVYVVENGQAAQRSIVLGQEQDSKVQVLEGLKPGELVIAEHSIEIAVGVKVTGK
jgi:RND family efflux transporter MFP subunit